MERRYVILAGMCVVLLGWFLVTMPSNDRDWRVDVSRLPTLAVQDGVLSVTDLRTFRYADGQQPRWSNASYDLSEIDAMYFATEPFGEWEAAAHTMLGWGFRDGRMLWLSVEARKEADEEYGVVDGLLREFELIYVFGDAADLLSRRVLYVKDPLFVFPLNVSPDLAADILVDAALRAQTFHEDPQMYNTITSTCTTNLRVHANNAKPGAVRWSLAQYLPGRADAFLYEQGLIATNVSLDGLRSRYNVTSALRTAAPEEVPGAIRAVVSGATGQE